MSQIHSQCSSGSGYNTISEIRGGGTSRTSSLGSMCEHPNMDATRTTPQMTALTGCSILHGTSNSSHDGGGDKRIPNNALAHLKQHFLDCDLAKKLQPMEEDQM